MSDQIQRLREVAEAATEGPWGWDTWQWQEPESPIACVTSQAYDLAQLGGWNIGPTFADDESVDESAWRAERYEAAKADAQHIATFDPPTVLELLDRLERAEAAVERVRAIVETPSICEDHPDEWWDECHQCSATFQVGIYHGVLRIALDGGER